MLTSRCNKSHVEAFLKETLSPDEERVFTAHLDECPVCCELLESSASVEGSWDDARRLLAGPGAELPSASEHTIPLSARQVLGALSPTDHPDSLGRLDHYEIRGLVGTGAMGVVLKAKDPQLDRIVALKVMNPSLADCGLARQRFARESRAAAAVLHPNVVPIHSVNSDAVLPYLAMPYLGDSTLRKRVETQGPLSIPEILRIGSQLASGLAASHKAGLIHRDIKPSNVLLAGGDACAVITDFGLARAIEDATMTRSGTITGTPEFMSPEQALGQPVSFASDMFSLGTVLYFLCTACSPFRAETAYGVLRRISDDDPRPIREINSDIPIWLCTAIHTLLSKDATQRPTADTTADLLTRCLAHVSQPDVVPLPDDLLQPAPKGSRPVRSSLVAKGTLLMLFVALLITTPFLLPQSVEPSPAVGPGNSRPTTSAAASTETPSLVFRRLDRAFPDPNRPALLDIDLQRGFIDVATHDAPHVTIEILTPPGRDEASSSDLKTYFSPRYDLRVSEETNAVKFDAYNQEYPLNLRVRVPVATNLRLDSYYDGYLRVEGTSGHVEISSQHSDITLKAIRGTVEAETRNGNISVELLEVTEGDCAFETYNGNVNLELPPQLRATLGIVSGSGNYRTDFVAVPAGSTAEAALVSHFQLKDPEEYLVTTINGGGIPFRIESQKGRVTVRKAP